MAQRYRKKTRPLAGSARRRRSIRKLKRWITFLLFLALGAGGGALLQGRVVSVADGDSLSIFLGKGFSGKELLGKDFSLEGISGRGIQERVRLYGIA